MAYWATILKVNYPIGTGILEYFFVHPNIFHLDFEQLHVLRQTMLPQTVTTTEITSSFIFVPVGSFAETKTICVRSRLTRVFLVSKPAACSSIRSSLNFAIMISFRFTLGWSWRRAALVVVEYHGNTRMLEWQSPFSHSIIVRFTPLFLSIHPRYQSLHLAIPTGPYFFGLLGSKFTSP